MNQVIDFDRMRDLTRMSIGKPTLQRQTRARALNGNLGSRRFAVVALAGCLWMSPSRTLASDESGFVGSSQCVQCHPDHGQARLELGDLLLQLGKPKLALSQLTAVSKESQTVSLPDLHFGLAKVYRRLGQLDKATAAARQSIRLLPDNPVAQRLLARLYQDAGQSEQARQALESYRELKERIERFSR